jgi:hypothetical protein
LSVPPCPRPSSRVLFVRSPVLLAVSRCSHRRPECALQQGLPSPPAPLDLSPRGYWLARWLDRTRNVDRCELTDYSGNPKVAEDYSPVLGTNPVPEELLRLKDIRSTDLWAVAGQDLVPVARLRNGTVSGSDSKPRRVARSVCPLTRTQHFDG